MSDLGVFGIGAAIGLVSVAAVMWAQRAQVRTSLQQLKRSSGEDSALSSSKGVRAGPVWILAGVTALAAGVGFAGGELLVALPNSILCAVAAFLAIRLGPSTGA